LQNQIILEYEKKDIKNKPEIKKLLQNYEKEIEKRRKNNGGVNDFRNSSGNTAVNSLNSSISNPPPYSLLPPPPTATATPPPPPYSPPLTPTPPISNPLNYVNEEYSEKGDLAIVLFSYIGINTDELTLNKNEYLIVTNWNVGDGFAYGYKRDDPQQKGKFPSPLVRKYTENTVRNSQYTTPLNNQSYNQQRSRFSMFSVSSSRYSITSSPSIAPSYRYRPSAPQDNRSSILTINSSHFSIASSPSIAPSIQEPPTAPLETALNSTSTNGNFENNQIE